MQIWQHLAYGAARHSREDIIAFMMEDATLTTMNCILTACAETSLSALTCALRCCQDRDCTASSTQHALYLGALHNASSDCIWHLITTFGLPKNLNDDDDNEFLPSLCCVHSRDDVLKLMLSERGREINEWAFEAFIFTADVRCMNMYLVHCGDAIAKRCMEHRGTFYDLMSMYYHGNSLALGNLLNYFIPRLRAETKYMSPVDLTTSFSKLLYSVSMDRHVSEEDFVAQIGVIRTAICTLAETETIEEAIRRTSKSFSADNTWSNIDRVSNWLSMCQYPAAVMRLMLNDLNMDMSKQIVYMTGSKQLEAMIEMRDTNSRFPRFKGLSQTAYMQLATMAGPSPQEMARYLLIMARNNRQHFLSPLLNYVTYDTHFKQPSSEGCSSIASAMALKMLTRCAVNLDYHEVPGKSINCIDNIMSSAILKQSSE